ncbi:carnitine acetyl transferase [Suillus occidentalis]|nr:carnitine acetyl transferase [Suillus occidentalis]
MATPTPTFRPTIPPPGRTFANQHTLQKLPVPSLEDTCKRYLIALRDGEGPALQERLNGWAREKASYIEDFWYESYLSHSDPVVLALNPFFVLENDPTPDRGSQLPRATALIISSLGFIHDLRQGLLDPDAVRGRALDMDQYSRLFGTARIPTECGCKMLVNDAARHIVVLRRGQFYWFDALDEDHRPLLTEREVLRNLQAICKDADKTPITEVARTAIGVLTTENRKTWSSLRHELAEDKTNAACLRLVDDALFVVCLDDAAPGRDGVGVLARNGEKGEDLAALCSVQVGTCTNRWYDKLQIIVCADGAAGVNFERTGVDGHTVLRFAADVFTEGLMLLARSINPSAPTLFHAPLSPHAKSYKPPKSTANGKLPISSESFSYNTSPSKLTWTLTPSIRGGIRYAETRLSDLICQNDCQALEFKGYGKNFITSHGFSPDAFVQMAFQAAYFGLYGRTECTYEPAMTKAFLHGRTEAIRTVQPESVDFTKTFFSECMPHDKIRKLHKACERHVQLTKECSQGLGQGRSVTGNLDPSPDDPIPNGSIQKNVLPSIFADPGWNLLSTSILSTSNCGNPALRLFGFGPVAADGYGIGYIIKENGISVVASSKHLQTRRFLDTLQGYLLEVQRILIQLNLQVAANFELQFTRPTPYQETGMTGRPVR